MIKYLAKTRRTVRFLPNVQQNWVITYFFFDFRAGRGLANSLQGLLRSFALQLSERLSRSRNLLAELNAQCRLDRDSVQGMTDAICKALNQSELYVLAFFDGLDEYAGDLAEVANWLEVIKDKSSIKICLGSRPEASIAGLIDRHPSIRMQDHNTVGISSYLDIAIDRARFESKAMFPESVKQEVVKSARGVFIWARLVVDELLDCHRDGDTAEMLREKLKEIPSGIEDMYQRILEKIRPCHKEEASVILHLVYEAGGSIDLEDLFGAWTIVFDPDADAKLLNHIGQDAFEKRLFALFSGILDVTRKFYGNAKSVRATHKTLQSYLDRSGWVWKNLSAAFKHQYPNSVWLRIYASAMEKTSAEYKGGQLLNRNLKALKKTGEILSYSPHILFPTIQVLVLTGVLKILVHQKKRSIESLQERDSREQMSMARRSITEGDFWRLAQSHEQDHGSSYKIIKRAMFSVETLNYVGHKYLLSVILLPLFPKRLSEGPNLITDPSLADINVTWLLGGSRRLHDLVLAIMYGLSGYYQDRLLTGLDITYSDKLNLLNLLIEKICGKPYVPKHVLESQLYEHSTPLWAQYGRICEQYSQQHERMAVITAAQTDGIQSRHVRRMIKAAEHKSLDETERLILTFRRLPQLRPPKKGCREREHGPFCERLYPESGLLYDWAGFETEGDPEDLPVFETLLDFLLDSGEIINERCYPGGNVLHAILDPSAFPIRARTSRYLKFLCAMKAGADPLAVGVKGDFFSYAHRFEKHVWRQFLLSVSKERKELVKNTLCDVKLIIDILEHYRVYGNWSLLDECYAQEVEDWDRLSSSTVTDDSSSIFTNSSDYEPSSCLKNLHG